MNLFQETTTRSNCTDIMRRNSAAESGVYRLYMHGECRSVSCDMATDMGGWTVRACRYGNLIIHSVSRNFASVLAMDFFYWIQLQMVAMKVCSYIARLIAKFVISHIPTIMVNNKLLGRPSSHYQTSVRYTSAIIPVSS